MDEKDENDKEIENFTGEIKRENSMNQNIKKVYSQVITDQNVLTKISNKLSIKNIS